MKKNTLFALWGGLFILCAGLGFIPEPAGAAQAVLTALSVCFFAPAAGILYGAAKDNDIPTLKLMRNLSALSLGLTLAALILNFLSALGSETLGNVLYYVLVVVSAPMICSGYWVLSLFLWACVLMVSLSQLKKTGVTQKR